MTALRGNVSYVALMLLLAAVPVPVSAQSVDECDASATMVCGTHGQTCRDRDLTRRGTWYCVCSGPHGVVVENKMAPARCPTPEPTLAPISSYCGAVLNINLCRITPVAGTCQGNWSNCRYCSWVGRRCVDEQSVPCPSLLGPQCDAQMARCTNAGGRCRTRAVACARIVAEAECRADVACGWTGTECDEGELPCRERAGETHCAAAAGASCEYDAERGACRDPRPACSAIAFARLCTAEGCYYDADQLECLEQQVPCGFHADAERCAAAVCRWDGGACGPVEAPATPQPTPAPTPPPVPVDTACRNVLCRNSGWCVAGVCECRVGFAGEACEECREGFSGPACEPEGPHAWTEKQGVWTLRLVLTVVTEAVLSRELFYGALRAAVPDRALVEVRLQMRCPASACDHARCPTDPEERWRRGCVKGIEVEEERRRAATLQTQNQTQQGHGQGRQIFVEFDFDPFVERLNLKNLEVPSVVRKAVISTMQTDVALGSGGLMGAALTPHFVPRSLSLVPCSFCPADHGGLSVDEYEVLPPVDESDPFIKPAWWVVVLVICATVACWVVFCCCTGCDGKRGEEDKQEGTDEGEEAGEEAQETAGEMIRDMQKNSYFDRLKDAKSLSPTPSEGEGEKKGVQSVDSPSL